MKYYLIAGEASGDLHGSNLMKQLKNSDSQAEFRFWGGNLMLEQGGSLVKHYRDLAFMGIFEVLANIRTIKKNFKICQNDLLENKPDVLILIDYPGFNLRMARFAKKHGIKVFYYISPKIWAWKKSRAKQIKAFVDKMFVIFPFETEFYKQFDYSVEYVGNPLLDAIEQKLAVLPSYGAFRKDNNLSEKPLVALLAGSRRQEINLILPEMLKVCAQFPDYEFVVAAAPSISKDFYAKIIQNQNVRIIYDKTYEVLRYSAAALVASGTATLETALLGVPQAVCYKVNPMTYYIGSMIVNIKFFSLVNIVMNKEVVKEFLQFDLAEKLKTELSRLLFDENYRAEMLENYQKLHKMLGEGGASLRSAQIMVKTLKA